MSENQLRYKLEIEGEMVEQCNNAIVLPQQNNNN